ncbi:MAG TPA: hypothetical protein VE398_02795 [Acidobacteriota bacterium]|nr:hypothetical protein [Acidobacteriota bacterium]
MKRLRLVLWNNEEARERADGLQAAGYEVAWEVPRGPEFIRELKSNSPDAVIIDLSRSPSQGRDMGLFIRKNAATRRIHLVFVSGEENLRGRIRELLPDAIFTSWSEIRGALRRAGESPLVEPRVPTSVFEGYSGTPLPKKLGIKAGKVVGLIEAPEGFEKTLGALPEGTELRDGARGSCNILICFTSSRQTLERRVRAILRRRDFASVWFAWPKKASGIATDLSEKVVREVGLASGLVDYKICAIDPTWSGLLFARRKSP